MTGVKYLIITLPADAAYIVPGDPEWFATSGATCHKLINILWKNLMLLILVLLSSEYVFPPREQLILFSCHKLVFIIRDFNKSDIREAIHTEIHMFREIYPSWEHDLLLEDTADFLEESGFLFCAIINNEWRDRERLGFIEGNIALFLLVVNLICLQHRDQLFRWLGDAGGHYRRHIHLFLILHDQLVQGEITILIHPVAKEVKTIRHIGPVLERAKEDRVFVPSLLLHLPFLLAGVVGEHHIELVKEILGLLNGIDKLIRDFSHITGELDNLHRLVRHILDVILNGVLIDKRVDSQLYEFLLFDQGVRQEAEFLERLYLSKLLVFLRKPDECVIWFLKQICGNDILCTLEVIKVLTRSDLFSFVFIFYFCHNYFVFTLFKSKN